MKNKFIKQSLSFVMALIMLLGIMPSAVFAEDVDYQQGTLVTYGDGDNEHASEAYTITVPALLKPSQSGTVTATGTWASNRVLTVTADETVTLTNSIKALDQKVLDVTFAGISKEGSNVEAVTATETVGVSDIQNALFGVWSGKFNYNVSIETAFINLYYRIGSNEQLTFVIGPEYSNFTELKLNDAVLIPNTDYSAEKTTSGTVIAITDSYLRNIAEGEYEIKINGENEYTIGTFTTVYTNVLKLDNVSQGYVDTTGNINSSTSTLCYTEPIGVKEGDILYTWYFNGAPAKNSARFIAAYDADGNIVESAGSNSTSVYTVPSGVNNLVFTLSVESLNEMMILKNTNNAPTRYIPYNDDESGMTNIGNIINVLNLNTLETGFVTTKGVITNTETLAYTKRIAVNEGDVYSLWHHSGGPTSLSFRAVAAYDANGKVVEAAGSDSTHSYTVPSGISHLVFTISKDSASKSMICKNSTITPPCYIAYNNNNAELDVPRGEHLINLFDKDNVNSGYMGVNGATSSASSLCYTNKIPVEEGDVLYVWNGSNPYSSRFITAFDGSGNAVSSKGYSSGVPTAYTVPEGITNVVFTIYTSAQNALMIFKNDNTVPPVYIPYKEIIEDEEDTPVIEYGEKYLLASGDMESDTTLTAGRADVITNKHLVFSSDVTSFEGLRLGHGYTDYTSGYVEIDKTHIKQYQYTSSTTMLKEAEHGLDIKDNIKITIDVNLRRVATVTIESNGQSYTFSTSTTWYGSCGQIYATSLGSVLPNAQLAWTCDGYSNDIHFYGDSYLSQSSDRWLYFAFNNGYTNALFDGYGGRGSGGAYKSLEENIKHSDPEIVVWMMGMNDGSDPDINTPSSTWATNRDKLIALAETEGFEIVFATIPTVPNINHEAKNKWIKESGYRYIDVAAAVGADGTGAWNEGMLSTDKVHPTATGSQAIYQQVIKDLPEFK